MLPATSRNHLPEVLLVISDGLISYREFPATDSIPSACEVPYEAGETEFATGRAACQRHDLQTHELCRSQSIAVPITTKIPQ